MTGCPAGDAAVASYRVDIQENPEIFARIGGAEVVAAVVQDFYRRVLGDPALAPAFEGVSMERLKAHQTSFLAAALGGGEVYRGRSMQKAHAGMAITKAQFTGVASHMHQALRGHVPEAEIEAILVTVASLQKDIVGQ